MTNTEILNQVHDALKSKSLDFEVKMAESFALVDGVYVPTGKFTPVRSDRQGVESIISGTSFSDHYTPIQNFDAFNVLSEMADIADIEFKNVGSWGNGGGIYAQISLGDITGIGARNDSVGKYISLVNSHDGTRALHLLVTPYRFFCANQISKAVNDASKKNRLVSIHHNIHGNKRLGEIGYALQHANNTFQKSEENYKRLADRVITMDEAREAIFRTMEPLKLEGQETGLVQKTWERRAIQFIDRFTDADNGQLDKLTGWNLYNAIQGAYQHGTKKTATFEKSLLIGRIANQAETSLVTVNDLLFNGVNAKTSNKEFDELFSKAA